MEIILLGAGSRGNCFARYTKEYGYKIVAVAEPKHERRAAFAKKHSIPLNMQFETWEEALAGPKYADAVINTTLDRIHYPSTIEALNKGYHILVEKPMSPIEEECRAMVEKAEEQGLILMVCHVLRYAPFFEKIKELLDAKRIGEIVNFQHTENVYYWHFAHSYVRGNFRNEKLASPWILAKSCHDLDLLVYLIGKKCNKVTSIGNLMHFKPENAPAGAPKICLEGCPAETTCPYFAPNIYLKQIQEVSWPSSMVSTDTSLKARYEALTNGSYGRCVYYCDNDVCDHQSAIFEFEGGTTATFNMVGFATEGTRTLRIYGTKGDLRGHLEKGEIEIRDFLTMEKEVIKVDYQILFASHGGGDARLMKDFIYAISGKDSYQKTTARLSLQSHLMAFAAEKSRKEGRSVPIG